MFMASERTRCPVTIALLVTAWACSFSLKKGLGYFFLFSTNKVEIKSICDPMDCSP